MVNFSALIEKESKKLHELHARIHETYALYESNHKNQKAWETACAEFHDYESPLDEYLDLAYDEKNYGNPDVLEFSVKFLEIDPWFFRSGYVKQILLTRLKRVKLNKGLCERINNILKDSVNKRGTREFKYYCRLAVQFADTNLITYLVTTSESEDTHRRARAKLMHEYIAKHKL